MNYLSHFVYNHEICGLPLDPHFVLAVVLPDLWLRFSRTRRIRWRSVRAATPDDAVDRALREGLLNHVDVDQRFHALPVFGQWQRDVRGVIPVDAAHPTLIEFLAHMSIELALDHRLLADDPALADRFYDVVATCDAADVARRVGVLGTVDTAGLDEAIRKFIARRFLRHYRTQRGLTDVVRIVLSLADISCPPEQHLEALIQRAVSVAEPGAVWRELRPGGQ